MTPFGGSSTPSGPLGGTPKWSRPWACWRQSGGVLTFTGGSTQIPPCVHKLHSIILVYSTKIY